MDRELSKKEIGHKRRKKTLTILCILGGVLVLVVLGVSLIEPTIKESQLRFGTADLGTIETSVSGTGKVVPAFEEIINSPITSRIIEVYCKVGDSVSAGSPLLRLDLKTAEAELGRLNDEYAIKKHEIMQSAVSSNTSISNLEMQIKVKEMSVNQLKEDVNNERRLDSIGSGTGERIRQAELAYNTARLELEQLHQQLDNEMKRQSSTASMKELELSISANNIAMMERTIDDASLKSPRQATLTYILNEVGRQVSAGERVAVIADLDHFKIEGQIADSYVSQLGVGSKTTVQLGKERVKGTITNISPQSQGGTIYFTILLEEDNNPKLRSGLTTQVYVLTDIKADVVRIPNGSFYKGPGLYNMYLRQGNHITRREVHLGQSDYQFVEVESGLSPGDMVVINDTKDFIKHKQLKLK